MVPAAVAGPGQWALLAGRDTAAATLDAKTIAELHAGLAGRDRQLRLMQLEIARLRAAGETSRRPAAKETAA